MADGFGGAVPVGNLLAGPAIEAKSVTAVLLVGAAAAVLVLAYARLEAPADDATGTSSEARAA